MRRRKGFKGTWFPVYGTNAEPNDAPGMGLQDSIITQNDGSIATVLTRVIPDEPSEDPDTQTLDQLMGRDYAIRRIVGKLAVVWTGSSGNATPSSVSYAKVAAGFFIARADDQEQAIPLGWPALGGIGSATDEDAFNSFSPLSARTVREPWIWRRTWVLGKSVIPGEGQIGEPSAPSSNLKYGSVLDGPHIDAKTRRRVKQDERLWFAISAVNWPHNGSDSGYTLTYDWDLDVRIFGAMRKARNSGAF